MAKEPTTNFPEQSAQSAMQVQNWLREMMEQNLNQTRPCGRIRGTGFTE